MQALPVSGAGTAGSGAHQGGADLQVDSYVLCRVDAFGEVARPGLESIDPGLDGVVVAAHPFHHEVAIPAVVDDVPQWLLVPARFAVVTVEEHGDE